LIILRKKTEYGSKFTIYFVGRTALHYAAVENNMNGALLLLKHGANIEAQDEHVSIDLVKGLSLLALVFYLA
jgi:hypothetical protein